MARDDTSPTAPRRAPHPRKAEALTLLLQGLTIRQVSEAVGVPRGTIQYWRQPLGLRDGRHPRRAEAEALLRQGQTIAQVAATVGATLRSVGTWRRALKLPRRRHPRRAEAEALIRQGLNDDQVASAVGIAANTAMTWRHELGLPPCGPPNWVRSLRLRCTPEETARLRHEAHRMLCAGESMVYVARELGVSEPQVGKWRKELWLRTSRRRRREEWPEPNPLRLDKADPALASIGQASRLRAMRLRRELGLIPAGGPPPCAPEAPAPSRG